MAPPPITPEIGPDREDEEDGRSTEFSLERSGEERESIEFCLVRGKGGRVGGVLGAVGVAGYADWGVLVAPILIFRMLSLMITRISVWSSLSSVLNCAWG